MRRRLTQLGTLAALASLTFLTSPASAQGGPDVGSSGPDAGAFGAFFVIAVIIGIGTAIYKFVSIRDMGIRRGMSRRDATTAGLFSDDEVTSTMILKSETTRSEPTRASRSEPTIEQRLTKIDSLLDQELITEAEAAERRAEILDEI